MPPQPSTRCTLYCGLNTRPVQRSMSAWAFASAPRTFFTVYVTGLRPVSYTSCTVA